MVAAKDFQRGFKSFPDVSVGFRGFGRFPGGFSFSLEV